MKSKRPLFPNGKGGFWFWGTKAILALVKSINAPLTMFKYTRIQRRTSRIWEQGMTLIPLFIIAVFAGCMLAASWNDMTSMTIPNWISVVLFVGFLIVAPLVWQGWANFGTHILVGLVCFAAGILMFALGWMGGGDAKLLAATSFWWVWADLAYYLFYTALAGGALALFLLLGRQFLPVRLMTTDWMHRLFKDEKRMPYGLALAFGALVTLPRSEIYQFAAGLM